MPRVKLDYIVSFSSEDSENLASNLLAYDVSKKKWLCNTGEPSCSVVLQLTHAVQISTVHIGACHAALVEVLVGRSETPNDPYEVLVPSSVFLSPMDSRRGAGVERVRSFSADQLGPAKSQRWDRVRVVCSQPYNKHCKYGLNFVHIFESEDKPRDPEPQSVAPAVPARGPAVGNYSSDEEDFKPGELFAKHLQRTSDAGTSKNTEAQIRQASSQALRNITDSSTKLVKTPISKTNNRPGSASEFNSSRERNTLMYTDDDDQPHAKIDSVVQRHKNEKEQENKKKEAVQNLFKKDKHANRLETASKNFKEFLDDKNLNSSKESSKDSDKRSKDDRNKDSKGGDRRHKDDLNHSRTNSNKDDERKNKDNLNNSRSKDSRDDDRRNKDMNNSRNKDSFRDNDRRNKDDEKASHSKTKIDNGPSSDSRKRQHSDDRQKTKDVLRAGPVSDTPHTLLRHVVFALSGYEHPRRGRIRDAAVAMGARFERDWNPSCTHLICAFPNTPKLRTVRSSPRGADCTVVRGEWVEQCCETRRLLPWQWFATEPKRKVAPPAGWDAEDKPASECDTDDEIEKVLRKQKKQRTDRSPSPQPHDTSPKPHSSRDRSPERSPKPQTSRERSPKPQTSRERSPKPQTSRERSPKPQTSRERSPKPQTSRERSPKPQTSRERSPKPQTSRERSPKPQTSRERSPKPQTSKERSPKPQNSRERSPKPQRSRERSPKLTRENRERSPKSHSRDRSPIPQTSRERSPKPNNSREKSPKPHSSREKSPKPNTSDRSPHRKEKTKTNLNYSNMSSDSDVAFIKDERIQANITIDSGESTDEEKPMMKEKVDKKSVLPDFFEGYTFVIDDGVEEAGFDKVLLERYVRAYGGLVIDTPLMDADSEINYVLTGGARARARARARAAAAAGRAVRAAWVWRCHRDRRLCDVDEYAL